MAQSAHILVIDQCRKLINFEYRDVLSVACYTVYRLRCDNWLNLQRLTYKIFIFDFQ